MVPNGLSPCLSHSKTASTKICRILHSSLSKDEGGEGGGSWADRFHWARASVTETVGLKRVPMGSDASLLGFGRGLRG